MYKTEVQPHGARLLTRLGRALVPPRVPAALDPLLVPESSGFATCPMALGMPPTRRGIWCRHMSHSSKPASQYGGLRRRHIPHGTEPATRQGRAPESPRVFWL
jgi:hypothetical protein